MGEDKAGWWSLGRYLSGLPSRAGTEIHPREEAQQSASWADILLVQ